MPFGLRRCPGQFLHSGFFLGLRIDPPPSKVVGGTHVTQSMDWIEADRGTPMEWVINPGGVSTQCCNELVGSHSLDDLRSIMKRNFGLSDLSIQC